jgi:hypothetical protein
MAKFTGWYLAEKELRAGRTRVTKCHLLGQRQKLVYAARFFAEKRGKSCSVNWDPRTSGHT